MAVSVRINSIVYQADGRVLVRTPDFDLDFPDLESVREFALSLDQPNSEGAMNAVRFGLGYWLARFPEGNNRQTIEGKTTTLDLGAVDCVKVR